MMYTVRPNHMGVQVGEVISYNPNKGHVKIKLLKELNLGDSISINNSSCKISELIKENNNIKSANTGQVVVIGRIKGKILKGDKVYKTVSEKLNKDIIEIFSKENIKRPINAKIFLKENEPIKLEIEDLWSRTKLVKTEKIIVKKADNTGITKDRIKAQLCKTGNTPFEMKEIKIIADDSIIVPISAINSIRRNALEELQEEILKSFKRYKKINNLQKNRINRNKNSKVDVSILLNNINTDINYYNLIGVDNVYIPFRLFLENEKEINKICKKFNTYVLLPAITKSNYEGLIEKNFKKVLSNNLKGIIVSNLSHIELLKRYEKEIDKLELIANYTINIFNNYTMSELKTLGIEKIIIPPELDKESIKSLQGNAKKEIIAYGRTLLMTTEYCLIGTVKNCSASCKKGTYKLKDRMGFEFPIYTDRVNCNNLIYNSKITSILWENLNVDSIRIDILDETEEEIQHIINIHKKGDRLEGENYTNGNLNRAI